MKIRVEDLDKKIKIEVLDNKTNLTVPYNDSKNYFENILAWFPNMGAIDYYSESKYDYLELVEIKK